jgi:hypothetical protein
MRHLMRDAIRGAALPDDCTLHGMRYTFATRGLELGLDWQTVESIVGQYTSLKVAAVPSSAGNHGRGPSEVVSVISRTT